MKEEESHKWRKVQGKAVYEEIERMAKRFEGWWMKQPTCNNKDAKPTAKTTVNTRDRERGCPLLASAPDTPAPNAAARKEGIAPKVVAPNTAVEETQANRPEGLRLGVTIAQHPCQRAV